MLERETAFTLFDDTVEDTRVSRESLTRCLSTLLGGLDDNGIAALLTDHFSCAYEYAQLIVGKDTCRRMSLLYNPHRLSTPAKGRKTVVELLKDKRMASGLARAYLAKAKGSSSRELLYQVIQWGTNNSQLCTEFPPFLARKLCLAYGVNSRSRVLDPCAGWGGRMIGVSTICDSYTAFEPSTKTFSGLTKLSQRLSEFSPAFHAQLHCQPFEESAHTPDSFDFALTSPPYYDTEIYSQETTQSAIKYKTFDMWVSGFFEPLIKKTMTALAPHGVFVLNIGSRQYPIESALRLIAGSYSMKKLKNFMTVSGLGKDNEKGESFFEIRK